MSFEISTTRSCCKKEKYKFEKTTGIKDIDFFGVNNTEKILKDVPVDASVKKHAKIFLNVAKGEIEGAQIIMFACKDVLGYDVKKTGLICGERKIDSALISIYNQKYINVANNYDNNGAATGMYPDAILPFNAAKRFGENKIKKGENQGIYVAFTIPRDIVSGTYSGKIIICVNRQKKVIPVELKVWDIIVPQKVNRKNIYNIGWPYQNGELDSSQEGFEKYVESLIKHRLAPDFVMKLEEFTDANIEEYCNVAYKYAIRDDFSNYGIPCKVIAEPDGDLSIDADVFGKFLYKLAKKSFETNYNLFDKLILYIGIIDEPLWCNLVDRTKKVITLCRNIQQNTANNLNNDLTIVSDIKAAVINSITVIPNIITAEKTPLLEGYVNFWCPKYTFFDTKEDRALYDNVQERWWYGCNAPIPPYPTLHLEDTLLSARLVGWMQAQYNITGNLYWGTNVYAVLRGSEFMPLEDYYSNASRFPYVNGDGFLFYPAAQYELDEPVTSLRLEGLRDGLEECELILQLKEALNKLNEKAEFIHELNRITATLFNGTKVIATGDDMVLAREKLFKLIVRVNLQPAEK